MIRATTLVYSSHNRSSYIHRDWIVERALQSHDNKTILYLPMSMGEYHQQEYGWSTFRWYFDRFAQWGLEAVPFFWTPNLHKEDVDLLFHYLTHFQVVILGGGSSTLGLQRYKDLGEHFYGDRDLFGKVLHERQNNGKLTVGFSAGADQLCDFLSLASDYAIADPYGFGLAKGLMVNLHHHWDQENNLQQMARKFPNCMLFGLPNDSGIALDQGHLPSGNIWQIIEFVIDCSWDAPEDGWHIKTRQGVNIRHFYCDGRNWGFNGGDKMVRVMSPDNRYQKAWLIFGDRIFDYWSQRVAEYHSIEHILSCH